MKVIFFLFLTLFTFRISAEKPDLIFQPLHVDKDLSARVVRSITEDARGYIWFGSELSLIKYDGQKLISISSVSSDKYSVSSKNITAFYNDSKGNLWIGTRNGLNLYDHIKDRFYNYKSDDHQCLKNITGTINSITEDKDGNIWVDHDNKRILKISSTEQDPEEYPLAENISVVQADENIIWIGTDKGLIALDIQTKTFKDLRGLYGSNYKINAIQPDGKYLWLGTNKGLKKINTQSQKVKSFEYKETDPKSINGNHISDFIIYDSNSLLIAIDGAGIDYFEKDSETFEHYAPNDEAQLSCKNITGIFKDSKNNIWAGTYLYGINYSTSLTSSFTFFKNNPLNPNVIGSGIITSFAEDKDHNLWVGTDGSGIYLKKHGSQFFHPYQPITGKGNISDVPIVALETDGNKVWMATYGGGLMMFEYGKQGLIEYKQHTDKKRAINNNFIRGVYKDKKGHIWFSDFAESVYMITKDDLLKFNFSEKTLPYKWVRTFFEDSKGNLWLATVSGLGTYDYDKKDFKTYNFHYPNAEPTELNSIISIYEDEQEKLWIATEGGLIKYDIASGNYTVFTQNNGVPNKRINALIEDNYNNLWLANSNGVIRFDLKNESGTPFTYRDGLPPYVINTDSKYKDGLGRIYFGTNQGYFRIDPRLITKNETIPPVYISAVKIKNYGREPEEDIYRLNEIINRTKTIRLEHDQNGLNFKFAALNYTNPETNQYAYKLEGFDPEWIYAGNQASATYTNLPPGNYTFRVKGSNNNNIWNDKGDYLSINIASPLWQKWWFYLLEIFFIWFLIYVFSQWRINAIQKQKEALEEIVSERTKEIKESNESLETFVYKASHDIKGPLKSVIGLTTVGLSDVKDENALSYFRHILNSTNKLEKLLMDLLQLTKVKQVEIRRELIDLKAVTEDALASFRNLPEFCQIKSEIIVNNNEEFWSDRKLIYSIVQNFIENAIKYHDPEKDVSFFNITIYVNKKEAELIFEDNGIGIAETSQKEIFDMFFKVNERSNGTGLGLYIVKTAVNKLKGEISLYSKAGEGSTFTVMIPNLQSEKLMLFM